MARHYRAISMDPGWAWDDRSDPNWSGGHYHGMRMQRGAYQAPYGRHRMYHAYDLGDYGGFDGRYDARQGRFDREGIYHEADDRWRTHPAPPRYDADYPRRVHDGGVHQGPEYLRQYNANSPALRRGQERSWGYAAGPDEPSMRGHDGRDGRTEERRYAGYNTGGFADTKYTGRGSRGGYSGGR